MSTLRQPQLQSKTQYISLEAFDQHIYTYSYNIRTKQGTLALTGVSAANAAGLVLLRDTGRRLKPSANPGVTTPMISVGFVGASDGLAYNGFIDPQRPDIFAHYTEHGSFTNPVSSDLYTSGTNTTGDITTTGVLTTTGGAAISGGQSVAGGLSVTTGGLTVAAGGLDVIAGGMDVSGEVNINTGSSGVTTIGTGGTGATNIGNATGGTTVTGTLTTSEALTVTTGGLDVLAGGMDVSGTVNINTGSSGVTTINTGGTGATNIGNATGNTAVTGTLTTSGALTVTTGGLDVLAGGMDVSGAVNINTGSSGVTTIGTGGTGATNIGNANGGTAVTGDLTVSTGLTLTAGNLTLPTGTGTESLNAVTINAITGTITTSSLTTGAGQTYLITMTNASITDPANRILVSIKSYSGTFGTNGIPIVASAACTAVSTAQIRIGNAHASAVLSGIVVLDFLVIR